MNVVSCMTLLPNSKITRTKLQLFHFDSFFFLAIDLMKWNAAYRNKFNESIFGRYGKNTIEIIYTFYLNL